MYPFYVLIDKFILTFDFFKNHLSRTTLAGKTLRSALTSGGGKSLVI